MLLSRFTKHEKDEFGRWHEHSSIEGHYEPGMGMLSILWCRQTAVENISIYDRFQKGETCWNPGQLVQQDSAK
jgi:hypothetical protein